MSLIEQHLQDHCHTAADVMRAAAAVLERRRIWEMPIQKIYDPEKRTKQSIPIEKPEPVEIQPDHPLICLAAQAAAFTIVEKPEPTIRDIQKTVCWIWNVNLKDMLSARRNKRICTPRHIAIVLTKMLKSTSLPKIGYNFGGRDHTTILHAVNKYEWLSSQLRKEGLDGKSLGHLAARAKELIDNGLTIGAVE